MSLLARRDKPLRVELPSQKEDRAITSKVGLVAAIGFLVGVAWPRVFGVEVGPSRPGGGAERPAATAAAPTSSADAPEAAAPPEPSASGATGAAPSNKQTVVVGDGSIKACRNKKGDKQEDCGKLSVDKLVKPRLAELASCPSALGLDGKLKVGVAFNFEKNEVVIVEDDRSSLPSSTVRGVLGCAGDEMKGVELEKITHVHARYTVVYELTFLPPGRTLEPETPEEGDGKDAGLGRATITWEKALVRETPEDGKVTTRLPQGTRVKLIDQKDDWYRIESGKTKGWVYRQAIGK